MVVQPIVWRLCVGWRGAAGRCQCLFCTTMPCLCCKCRLLCFLPGHLQVLGKSWAAVPNSWRTVHRELLLPCLITPSRSCLRPKADQKKSDMNDSQRERLTAREKVWSFQPSTRPPDKQRQVPRPRPSSLITVPIRKRTQSASRA